jgi:hypothetical protein
MGLGSVEEATREFAEKAGQYAKFLKENRLYAFRMPTEMERAVEEAVGERLFMPPNPKQAELLKGWLDPGRKVFSFTGGNRLGKTTIGTILALSTLFGRLLWEDRKLEFPHGYGRKVRYVGQGWETHIKSVVIPSLKFWWPRNRPLETKKNNQGVEATWKDMATGSVLEVMSTTQEADVFEGWDGDLVVYDEPPPRDIRVACARGLIDRRGRELFVATLLKEAWIHREVIKARLPDGRPDPTIYNVTGQIYDNVGYGLTQEGVEQFIKTLKPEELAARIEGKPSYMANLVCPRFDREKHVKKAFQVPLDAIVDFSIDFHPAKPWAVVFLATFKSNFKYVCHEMELRGNPKYVGEEIIRYLKSNNLRVGRGIIDPLAAGDKNNDETVFDILSGVLGARGILLETASKDKENGIALLNNLLWTENEMPGLFFFDSCVRTIQQVEDWMYDAETLKPSKEDDDFVEALYRLALLDTQWYSEDNYNLSLQKNVIV